MVVTTVKTILDIIKERGIIIDTEFFPKTREEFEQHIDDRIETDAGYIEIRYQTHPYKLDLTEFLVLPPFTVEAIQEANNGKPFSGLRAFIFSELEEAMFMIDFEYMEADSNTEYKSYILKEVTVYDSRDNKAFKNEFSLNGKASEYGILMYDTVSEILEATSFIENKKFTPEIDGLLNAGINI
jgi:hypothetical protein